MLTAATTLLAVVAGGVLTYFVQARLDRRRNDRERERDREAAEREQERQRAVAAAELRVAKRLLLEELDTIALHHAMLAKERRYPLRYGTLMFPTEAWEADKRTLADGLSDSQWEAVTTFMHTVPRVRLLVMDAEPLSDVPAELVGRFRDGAMLARQLYELLAGVPASSVNERGEPDI